MDAARPRRRTRRLGAVCASAFLLLGLIGTPALAHGGMTQIEAVAVGSDCGDADFGLEFISGDLDGCLAITVGEFTVTPSGAWHETGTEVFTGCLWPGTADETCGTFSTEYRFSAKFAEDGSEIHGRCQHPITGGTGGLEGIDGRIDFKDDIEAGEFLLRGHVRLPHG